METKHIKDEERHLKRLLTERNRFRRGCRLTAELGRMKKAWRVGGTAEAGRDAMYGYEIERARAAIRRARGEDAGQA